MRLLLLTVAAATAFATPASAGHDDDGFCTDVGVSRDPHFFTYCYPNRGFGEIEDVCVRQPVGEPELVVCTDVPVPL